MPYYDYIAPGYNELFGVEQRKKSMLISSLVRVKETDKLLDVGSGTGICLNYFKCFKVGIDPAIKLLMQNRHNCIQADAEHIPFKDKSFDVVISVTAIHNFADVEKGLQEIKRVGKGNFILTLIKTIKTFKEIEALLEKHFTVKEKIEEAKDIIFLI